MSDAEFAEYVTHRSPALLRTAYLLCGGDRGAAEDLLQEVLERMFPRWRRIRDDPEPYIRASLANAAANRWRRRSRRVTETPMTFDVEHPLVSGPEQRVLNQETVVRALSALPPRMRAVLVLRYFDDLSEVDTAAALRCGVGTVKSQTSKGLARLREVMGASETTNRSS
jgi:RNA polymerase sigma-70 factor (sigma-E family)